MTPTEIREAWLRQRQTGIGSSDAANLIGVGYHNANHVYHSKIDPAEATAIDGDLLRGIDLEPLVARKYAEAMGKELVPAGFVRSTVNPWQFSNPDFIGLDDRYVEVKTTRGFDEDRGWGEPFTDEIPEKYFVQCQHQLGVRGDCDHMDLAAFDIYGWTLRIYRIRFDPEFFAWLTNVERMAWERIVARKPLGVDWEDQFVEEYRRHVVRKDSAIVLPDEYGPKLDELYKLKQIVKEAEIDIDRLKDEVQRAIGTTERATVGNWKVKRIVTSNNQLRLTPTPIDKGLLK